MITPDHQSGLRWSLPRNSQQWSSVITAEKFWVVVSSITTHNSWWWTELTTRTTENLVVIALLGRHQADHYCLNRRFACDALVFKAPFLLAAGGGGEGVRSTGWWQQDLFHGDHCFFTCSLCAKFSTNSQTALTGVCSTDVDFCCLTVLHRLEGRTELPWGLCAERTKSDTLRLDSSAGKKARTRECIEVCFTMSNTAEHSWLHHSCLWLAMGTHAKIERCLLSTLWTFISKETIFLVKGQSNVSVAGRVVSEKVIGSTSKCSDVCRSLLLATCWLVIHVCWATIPPNEFSVLVFLCRPTFVLEKKLSWLNGFDISCFDSEASSILQNINFVRDFWMILFVIALCCHCFACPECFVRHDCETPKKEQTCADTDFSLCVCAVSTCYCYVWTRYPVIYLKVCCTNYRNCFAHCIIFANCAAT